MGDVGEVAKVVGDIFKYATDPNGYHTMSLDQKLGALKDAVNLAIAQQDFSAVDRLNAEYDRLAADIV